MNRMLKNVATYASKSCVRGCSQCLSSQEVGRPRLTWVQQEHRQKKGRRARKRTECRYARGWVQSVDGSVTARGRYDFSIVS